MFLLAQFQANLPAGRFEREKQITSTSLTSSNYHIQSGAHRQFTHCVPYKARPIWNMATSWVFEAIEK